MDTYLLYITAADRDEARRIGKKLVMERLAACANIIDNMNAMYIWRDQFHDESEAVLIVKTTGKKVRAVIDAVKSMHSYVCPCIVSLPIADGYTGFLEWVADQVR